MRLFPLAIPVKNLTASSRRLTKTVGGRFGLNPASARTAAMQDWNNPNNLDIFLPSGQKARQRYFQARQCKRVAIAEAAFYAAWTLGRLIVPDATEAVIAHEAPAAVQAVTTCQSSLEKIFTGKSASNIPFRMALPSDSLPKLGTVRNVTLQAPRKSVTLNDQLYGRPLAEVNQRLGERVPQLIRDCLGDNLAGQMSVKKLSDSNPVYELYVSTPDVKYKRVGLVEQRFYPSEQKVEETVTYYPQGANAAASLQNRQPTNTVLLEQATVFEAPENALQAIHTVFTIPLEQLFESPFGSSVPSGMQKIQRVVVDTALEAPASTAQEAAQAAGLPVRDGNFNRLGVSSGVAKWSADPLHDEDRYLMEFSGDVSGRGDGKRFLAYIAPQTFPLPS